MRRLILCCTLALAGLLPGLPAPAEEGPTPEAVLKAKGLKRSGTSYLLSAELAVQKKLNQARGLYRDLSVAAMRKEEFERGLMEGKAEMQQMEQEYVMLNQQIAQFGAGADRNQMIARSNMLAVQINNMKRQEVDPDVRQVPGARLAAQREEFVQAVIELRQLVDQTNEAYEGVGKDEEVRSALAAINQKTRMKVTLGPSKGYLANVKLLEKVETSVLTESVELRKQDGVHWIDVTFNGKTTRPMVFDTGASTLVLPADLAGEVELRPVKDNPTVKARVADGSEVEARRMIIPSVRVGKFTVKDVECIVMPAGKTNVAPLLGQTFHRHFIYKFSPDAGKLVLSKVDTPDAAVPASKTRGSSKPARGKRSPSTGRAGR